MSKKEIEKQIYYIEFYLNQFKQALASDSQLTVNSQDVLRCAMQLDKLAIKYKSPRMKAQLKWFDEHLAARKARHV